MELLRRKRGEEYVENFDSTIVCDKQRGVFESAFTELGDKPVNYWFS
jgi:hypothetical protein